MTITGILAPTAAAVPLEALVLARTDTLTRAVHLAECPHLVDRSWHLADQGEIDAHRLCQWSQDQLSGHGRLHPDTLDDAMRLQGTPAEAKRLIKEALTFVTFDEIWLPYSKSYVALGLDGRAVAAFGKSYVWVGGSRVDLPGYVAGRHAGRSTQPSYGETCTRHHIAKSLSGVCDLCD